MPDTNDARSKASPCRSWERVPNGWNGPRFFVIRPAQRSDVGPIQGLLQASGAFRPGEVECALELVEEYLAGDEDYRVIVAEEKGQIVGYVCYGPTPLAAGVFDLYWIAAHPPRRGVGAQLLEHVEQRVREQGGRMVVIETASQTLYEGAQRFYQARGYQLVTRIEDFYSVGDAKLVYLKRF